MNNGWRSALLGIWVSLLVVGCALAIVGFTLQGKAQVDGDLEALGRAGVLLGGAGACASGVGLFLVLWIVVSAIVLEHEKDRRVWRGLDDR
jgi:hypothetical protein